MISTVLCDLDGVWKRRDGGVKEIRLIRPVPHVASGKSRIDKCLSDEGS